MLSEDGSGRGAALVAAVATRMAQEKAAKSNGGGDAKKWKNSFLQKSLLGFSSYDSVNFLF